MDLKNSLLIIDYASEGLYATLSVLLDMKPNVNVSDVSGITPLMLAVRKSNDLRVVKMLLKAGASVKAETSEGWIALTYAAYHTKNSDIIKALIKAGADVKHTNRYGWTPLMYACKKTFM